MGRSVLTRTRCVMTSLSARTVLMNWTVGSKRTPAITSVTTKADACLQRFYVMESGTAWMVPTRPTVVGWLDLSGRVSCISVAHLTRNVVQIPQRIKRRKELKRKWERLPCLRHLKLWRPSSVNCTRNFARIKWNVSITLTSVMERWTALMVLMRKIAH